LEDIMDMVGSQAELIDTQGRAREPFPALVERLNTISARKRHEAYRDLEWDAPECRIEPHDARFCLGPEHPLGASAWYAELPPPLRAELGLECVCVAMKLGASFEAVLCRGLLEFAGTLPNRSPEYRYVLHEVVEEANHSLMFQELINRAGCDPQGVGALEAWLDRRVARWGATFPELFFCFVLAGEIFIDHENRERLRRRHELHPLVARILQIHVTEEARHVCFARRYLEDRLPALSPLRRQVIRLAMPLILRSSETVLSQPSPRIVQRFRIPRAVLHAAYGPGSEHRKTMQRVAEPFLRLTRGEIVR
jgi:hypothetical protein